MGGKEKEGREGRGKGKGGARKVVCPGARAGSRRAWGRGRKREGKGMGWLRACKQHTEKCFIHPLSDYRMCMDPSPTGFYRVVQKVSDVIPVLGIMTRLPFLFSRASSSVVA